jgi:hypothetical protein
MPAEKIIYEYWQHKVTRELYAVRLVAKQVTGINGPLVVSGGVDLNALPHYPYDDDSDRVRWIQERVGEFLLRNR